MSMSVLCRSKQVIVNIQRIYQGAPRCLTVSSSSKLRIG